MGFLNKIFNTVRLAGDLVDHGNDTTVYDQSTQTIGSGAESANVSSISNAGDITDSGNSNTIYDQSTQTIGSGSETADLDTATASQARFGTVSSQGDVFRLIGRETPGSDTGSIQFTGLSNDVEYRLWVSSSVSGGTNVFVRMNGDGATTGNYDYWDASGTKQTGQNEFLVMSSSGAAAFANIITFANTDFSNTNRIGLNNRLLPGTVSAISDFGREGGRDTAENLNSIELQTGGSFNGGRTVVELWERDYS